MHAVRSSVRPSKICSGNSARLTCEPPAAPAAATTSQATSSASGNSLDPVCLASLSFSPCVSLTESRCKPLHPQLRCLVVVVLVDARRSTATKKTTVPLDQTASDSAPPIQVVSSRPLAGSSLPRSEQAAWRKVHLNPPESLKGCSGIQLVRCEQPPPLSASSSRYSLGFAFTAPPTTREPTKTHFPSDASRRLTDARSADRQQSRES